VTREARLEDTEHGRVAATDGWFVVNVRDAAWVTDDLFGAACIFEGDGAPFEQVGFTLGVLSPGGRAASTTVRPTRRTCSSSPHVPAG
jgi:hypothetical protein